jgi:hypothetical protein
VRIIAACAFALTFASSAFAITMSDLSPNDFDLVRAVMAGGWASKSHGTSQAEIAALQLYSFYIGRLTGRDDTTQWHTVVLGRVAELHGKSLFDELKACTDLYISRTK